MYVCHVCHVFLAAVGQYALEPLTTLRHLTQLFCDDYDSVGPLGEELENLELKKQVGKFVEQ